MMKIRSYVCLAFCLIALLATEARADRRIFGYVYPYQTLPQDTLELEHYLDAGINHWDNPDTVKQERDWTRVAWQHQFELEYGVTDHLEVALYNVFSQAPFGDFRYDGLKLRSRYRFAEQGQLAVDPAVYLELVYFGDKVEAEGMLILAKRVGRFEFAFNAKVEEAYQLNDKAWELELTPLLGIGYHLTNGFSVGIESMVMLEREGGELEYVGSYLGPALSVSTGRFYWTTAAQAQLGKKDGIPAVQVRSLIGLLL
jgi:hypothetical protein